MRRKLTYTLLAIVGFISLKAQNINLVQNGSFELVDTCPDEYHQLEKAFFWNSPNYRFYYNPYVVGSELFASCAPFAINVPNNPYGGGNAPDGNKYAGGYFWHSVSDTFRIKNYFQNILLNPLKPNTYYCFRMLITLCDDSYYCVKDISVFFSENSISDSVNHVLSYLHPQITNLSGQYYQNKQSWDEYTGYFRADGGEKYMTIGGFLPTDSTTKLVLSQGQLAGAFYMIDNVQLYECDSLNSIEENSIEKIKIYPNPAQDFVSVDIPQSYTNAQLFIYNLTGQLIMQKQLTQNKQQIPITELGNGMYIFVVQNEERVIGRQRVVVVK